VDLILSGSVTQVDFKKKKRAIYAIWWVLRELCIVDILLMMQMVFAAVDSVQVSTVDVDVNVILEIATIG